VEDLEATCCRSTHCLCRALPWSPLAYTYEVTTLVAGERLVMSTKDGPFPMETSYDWTDSRAGGTRMALRNRGEPSGFGKVSAPIMTRAMRRANRKDLAQLKRILEASPDR